MSFGVKVKFLLSLPSRSLSWTIQFQGKVTLSMNQTVQEAVAVCGLWALQRESTPRIPMQVGTSEPEDKDSCHHLLLPYCIPGPALMVPPSLSL